MKTGGGSTHRSASARNAALRCAAFRVPVTFACAATGLLVLVLLTVPSQHAFAKAVEVNTEEPAAAAQPGDVQSPEELAAVLEQLDPAQLEQVIGGEWTKLSLSVAQFELPSEPADLIGYLKEGYVPYDATLSLDEAIELALKHNHNLNSKRLDAAAAVKGVEINWTDLKPQLGLQGKAYWQQSNVGANMAQERDLITSLALSLTQRIYDFGLTNDLIDLAEAQHAIEKYSVDMAEQQLMHDLVNAWYTFNLALGQARIRSDEVELAERFLEQTQIQYKVGTVPRLDVIRAEARVEQARSGFIAAQAQLGDAAALFYSVLGVEDTRYIPQVVSAGLIERGRPAADLDQTIAQALDHRPEIQLQYATLFAGESAIELTANRPILQGYASAFYQQPATQGFTDAYEYGVELLWNFYTGGRSRKEREQAELSLAALTESLFDLEAKIELDATTSWNRLQASYSTADAARKNLELSGEGLKAAAVGYGAGVTPYIEFQEALDQNVAAALAYLGALVEIKLAWINLERAQGFPNGYPGDHRACTPDVPSAYAILGIAEPADR